VQRGKRRNWLEKVTAPEKLEEKSAGKGHLASDDPSKNDVQRNTDEPRAKQRKRIGNCAQAADFKITK